MLKFFVGFDAFEDVICRAKGGRSLQGLAQEILEKGGNSSAVAVEGTQAYPGGNGVNYALALGHLGGEVDLVAPVGEGEPRPLFEQGCAENVRMHSFGEPGSCFALDFGAEKLFLADTAPFDGTDWARVESAVGRGEICQMSAQADVICLCNWGESEGMHDLWQGYLQSAVKEGGARPKYFLVDPSDMGGRSDEEIRAWISLLGEYAKHGKCVLTLNEDELLRIGRVMEAEGGQAVYNALAEKAGLYALAVHGLKEAVAFLPGQRASCPTWRVPAPSRTTGGGDHFGAALAYALCLGWTIQMCLRFANGAASLFVRRGVHPSYKQVAQFLQREGML